MPTVGFQQQTHINSGISIMPKTASSFIKTRRTNQIPIPFTRSKFSLLHNSRTAHSKPKYNLQLSSTQKWTPTQIISEIDKIKNKLSQMTVNIGSTTPKKQTKGKKRKEKSFISKKTNLIQPYSYRNYQANSTVHLNNTVRDAESRYKIQRQNTYIGGQTRQQTLPLHISAASYSTSKMNKQNRNGRPTPFQLFTQDTTGSVHNFVSLNGQQPRQEFKRSRYCLLAKELNSPCNCTHSLSKSKRSFKIVNQNGRRNQFEQLGSAFEKDRFVNQLKRLEALNRDLLRDNCLLASQLRYQSTEKQTLQRRFGDNTSKSRNVLSRSEYKSYLQGSQMEERDQGGADKICGAILTSSLTQQYQFGARYDTSTEKKQNVRQHLARTSKLKNGIYSLSDQSQDEIKVTTQKMKQSQSQRMHRNPRQKYAQKKRTNQIKENRQFIDKYIFGRDDKVHQQKHQQTTKKNAAQSKSKKTLGQKCANSNTQHKQWHQKQEKQNQKTQMVEKDSYRHTSRSTNQFQISEDQQFQISLSKKDSINTESILLEEQVQRQSCQKDATSSVKVGVQKNCNQRLKRLEQYFNELIGLSHLQKNLTKKMQLRKQLSQIAKQIHTIRNQILTN